MVVPVCQKLINSHPGLASGQSVFRVNSGRSVLCRMMTSAHHWSARRMLSIARARSINAELRYARSHHKYHASLRLMESVDSLESTGLQTKNRIFLHVRTYFRNQGTPPAQLPVAIDYSAALALRQMAVVQDELPKYLLAPEVSALLHYAPPTFTARCCWPPSGIRARVLTKRWH